MSRPVGTLDVRQQCGVVVLDDEVFTALEISRVLMAAGFRVVATLSRALDFFAAVSLHRPSLAFVDIRLGSHDGVDLVGALPSHLRPLVVYVSGCDDEQTLQRAGDSGGVGYVVKPFLGGQLIASAELGLRFGASRGVPRPDDEVRGILERLSAREYEVALALFRERRIARVSKMLYISAHTVRNHLKAIFTKCEVHSQEELFDLLERRAAAGRLDRP
jgi:DNA-binding NarL/FixJ family response regulator